MASQTMTLRLPVEDVQKLNLLAKIRGTTKTEIIRSALAPVLQEAFERDKQIILSDTAFQSILDYLDQGPSEEIQAKRAHLFKKYQGWQACNN